MSIFSHRQKINELKWFDIIALTVILWGSSILSSTEAYIALCNGAGDFLESEAAFTAADNYAALSMQAFWFLLAFLYLLFRNFDFRRWKIQFNPKAIVWGVLLFVGAALLQDIYGRTTDTFAHLLPFPGSLSAFFDNETVSTVIYSVFNGIYEEIYFLGICLSLRPTQWKWVIPFSLLIRVSFHTYQGMLSAIGIGIVFGLYMLYAYKKSPGKNLLPFFIAHALADIFGLGLLWMLGI